MAEPLAEDADATAPPEASSQDPAEVVGPTETDGDETNANEQQSSYIGTITSLTGKLGSQAAAVN